MEETFTYSNLGLVISIKPDCVFVTMKEYSVLYNYTDKYTFACSSPSYIECNQHDDRQPLYDFMLKLLNKRGKTYDPQALAKDLYFMNLAYDGMMCTMSDMLDD